MCGNYHGGDGLKFIEVVEEALERAPSLYLGEAAFSELADLAARVQAKQDLAGSVQDLEAMIGDESTAEARREEAERLLEAIKTYVNNQLETATGLAATSPAEVVPLLARLDKELSDSSLGERVTDRYKAAKKDKGLKKAARLHKSFAKIRGMLAELKSCDTCKGQDHREFRHTCAGCRVENQSAVQGARKALGSLVRKNPDLPYTQRIKSYLEELE